MRWKKNTGANTTASDAARKVFASEAPKAKTSIPMNPKTNLVDTSQVVEARHLIEHLACRREWSVCLGQNLQGVDAKSIDEQGISRDEMRIIEISDVWECFLHLVLLDAHPLGHRDHHALPWIARHETAMANILLAAFQV